MTTRERLPGRRQSYTTSFEHDFQLYTATWSLFEDGRLAEVFLISRKPNSTMDVLASDCGKALSLALQYGCPADVLRDTLVGRGEGIGPIGVLLTMIVETPPPTPPASPGRAAATSEAA